MKSLRANHARALEFGSSEQNLDGIPRMMCLTIWRLDLADCWHGMQSRHYPTQCQAVAQIASATPPRSRMLRILKEKPCGHLYNRNQCHAAPRSL